MLDNAEIALNDVDKNKPSLFCAIYVSYALAVRTTFPKSFKVILLFKSNVGFVSVVPVPLPL